MLVVSTAIVLAEIWSEGVGTFLVFSALTGIPLKTWKFKGFSEKVLLGMFCMLSKLQNFDFAVLFYIFNIKKILFVTKTWWMSGFNVSINH